MEFEVSIADMRNRADAPQMSLSETDCVVIADPAHTVGDLAAALAGPDGGRAGGIPELWLDGAPLDPAAALVRSGIRDGARVGIGGSAPGSRTPERPGVAEIRVVAGPDAGLVVPVGAGEHVIARDGGRVRLADTDVSRRAHCVVTVTPAAGGLSCTVRDAKSTNGTGLDGAAVGTEPVPVQPGQLITAGRNLLTVALPQEKRAVVEAGDPDDPLGQRFSRPPRSRAGLPRRVAIDLASTPAGREGLPSWFTMLLGPVLSLGAGAVIVAVTGQWLFLLLGLGGIAVSLVNQVSGRRKASARRRAEQRRYQDESMAGENRLARALAEEQQRRREAAPDPACLERIATGPGARLWERAPSDEDFLQVRVGWADLPAASVELRAAPGAPEPVVRNVPVTVALTGAGVLGIAGPADLGRAALSWLVCQLAVLHRPGDLQLVVLTEDPDAWSWTRWLPHLRSLPGTAALASVGADPASCAARAAELRDLVDARGRAAADPRRPDRRSPLPAVVVVLDGSYRLRQLPGMSTVLTAGPAAGVYTICRDDDWNQLPRDCGGELLVEAAGGGRAAFRDRSGELRVSPVDRVSRAWADRVARALAPLRDVAAGGQSAMPGTVRLLDLWGMGRPEAAPLTAEWRRRGRTTAVPLGETASGTFAVDLAHDGPHMLVAGTTGAGKSEFLQTLVASLAMGNPPDALAFVLIDYKGGSAFAGCAALPHVAGFLTDLDEHLTRRALTALAAEVRYREQVLYDAGCKDIDAYHAAREPLGPLPRLVLVVDEFRFLVAEVPDFLERLADITARGRSLGMHLVLATQRPAGVVSEDIRTNMALRVCFRVEDAADSTAVVEFPDAAAIDRRFRGRGYARTGHGAAVLFQGAYVSGMPPGAALARGPLRVSARPFAGLGAPPPTEGTDSGRQAGGRTDLAALVEAAREAKQQAPAHRPWLDPLPAVLPLPELPPAGRGRELPLIPYGLADLPDRQQQPVTSLDLEDGGHLLAGGPPRSGRTTLLRTVAAGIARDHSPADVHLYVLDCDTGALASLAGLPHCGAVVRRTERERAGRLLDRLAAEVSRRQELLTAAGFGSVTEQRLATAGSGRLPYLVLLLDKWEAFLTDLGQVDNGRLPDLMYRLLNEGASAGLRILATGDRTALTRLASYFPSRLVLQMADANDLAMVGVPKGVMPPGPPPGRAVALPAPAEVHVAVAGTDPDGGAQNAALDLLIQAAGAAWPQPQPAPLRVDVLPARIRLAEAESLPGRPGAPGPLRPLVAVGGDELSRLTADLGRFPGFAIAGPPLSGRSSALLVMAGSLLENGAGLVVFAPRESPLRALAGQPGVLAVVTGTDADQRVVAGVLESAAGPVAVLVDDAEALHQARIGDLLAQIPAEGRGRGHALVVAGTSGELLRTSRGFTAAARQFRCGLLLTPEAPQLGQELFGTRLPRSAAFDRPAGRGYLIQGSEAVLAQVPQPSRL